MRQLSRHKDPSMEDLAPRQQQVLDFIATSIQQQGIPPSLREIGDALQIRSTNGVADHIKALVKKGYLERVDSAGRGRARAIRLTTKSTGRFTNTATVAIPIVGRVAAGIPILAEENYDGAIHMDAKLVPKGATVFALEVVGESMIEDGIFEGDYVFVSKQESANNGDTVVAMVEDEATVKRFYREAGHVRLQPANSTMKPILVSPDEPLTILGKVVGVYRQL
jgi:repressor LexA